FHLVLPLTKLRQPIILSSGCLQQLRANIREMEKLCGRVRAEDAAALEKLVKPVKDRASAATRDFLQLHSNPALQIAPLTPPDFALPSGRGPSTQHAGDDMDEESVSGWQIHTQLPEIPVEESAAESWDNLEEDLKQLSSLVSSFSVLVHVSMNNNWLSHVEPVCISFRLALFASLVGLL
ncbi:syntaxin-17-like, partial [Hippocampus comes]|uniref:syntaxin-17-like n=1 Tax=Hippocampus comes TaxID=109280 RepID=UPI00094E54CE